VGRGEGGTGPSSMALLTPMRNTLPLYAHFRASAANKKMGDGATDEKKRARWYSPILGYLGTW